VSGAAIGIVGAGEDASALHRLVTAAGHVAWLRPADDADLPILAAGRTILAEASDQLASGPRAAVMARLDELASREAILATTAIVDVGAVASGARLRDRVAGLHPVARGGAVRLIEITAIDYTDRRVVARLADLAAAFGVGVCLCQDTPGLVVPRLRRALTAEAFRLVAGGVSREVVEAAAMSLGPAAGPLRLAEGSGIAAGVELGRALDEALHGAPRLGPTALELAMLGEGQGGLLSADASLPAERPLPRGAPLAPDAPLSADASLPAERPLPRGVPRAADRASVAAVAWRITLVVVNEAYRIVGDGAADIPDIDLAVRAGLGFAQGPFELAGRVGLRAIVEGLHRLRSVTEGQGADQYEVAPLLWQVATV
jgi:3-hydroxyacyl-CoA dehydrogenase